MCNFGTESKIQTLALNGVIEKIPYLSKMRDEVMSYPDKQKYDKFEQNEMYENILQQPVVIPFNDVWDKKMENINT